LAEPSLRRPSLEAAQMTDLSSSPNPFFPFNIFGQRPGFSMTVGGLNEPILPGWSFGNVIVNNQNSGAPATEGAIVSKVSYGRQLGWLVDAVVELIRLQDGPENNKAFMQVEKLQACVDDIKTEAAEKRLQHLRADLDRLRVKAPKAYEREMKALRELLKE
jgi:hypothetical protein